MTANIKKPKLSIVITAKNLEDPKLKDLLLSIEQQDYPKKLIETKVVTRGNSESAKAIGVRESQGQIVCIMASDNCLPGKSFISKCMKPFKDNNIIGAYPLRYHYKKDDDILNRYFALMGVNDVIPFYLQRNDRQSHFHDLVDIEWFDVTLERVPTLGDNGFFIRRGILMKADLDHYFHIDVCQDLFNKGYRRYAVVNTSIWHRTGGNIFKFFIKRFIYADKLHEGRRWHMVEPRDIPRLIFFILSTMTLIFPILISIKGYRRVRDVAWFLHLPVCILTLGVYGLWSTKVALLSVASIAQRAFKGFFNL